jgi:hypothetical protein
MLRCGWLSGGDGIELSSSLLLLILAVVACLCDRGMSRAMPRPLFRRTLSHCFAQLWMCREGRWNKG